MTNRYRFRIHETAIAKLTKPISSFGLNGTFKAYDTDVTVLNSFKRIIRGREKIYYTCTINNPTLYPIFGQKIDILDENGNLRKIKSKRTRYLSSFK